jgi:hypothetical protein
MRYPDIWMLDLFSIWGTGAFMIMRKFNGMDEFIPDDLYVPFHNYDDPKVCQEIMGSVYKIKTQQK